MPIVLDPSSCHNTCVSSTHEMLAEHVDAFGMVSETGDANFSGEIATNNGLVRIVSWLILHSALIGMLVGTYMHPIDVVWIGVSIVILRVRDLSQHVLPKDQR